MRIGIVGWRSNEHFGVSLPYATYLAKFGQVVPLTPSNEIDPTLNLVVLPGGPDLATTSLGVPPNFNNSNVCQFREYFYRVTLAKYIAAGIPIFGICLGAQQLNVKFGGGLTQHYPFPYSDTRDKQVEDLYFTPEGQEFRKLIGDTSKKVQVNSMHHQGIFNDQLANGFIPLAYSGEKNVEVFKHATLPIAGVQYHPEELGNCPIANNLIRLLLGKLKTT